MEYPLFLFFSFLFFFCFFFQFPKSIDGVNNIFYLICMEKFTKIFANPIQTILERIRQIEVSELQSLKGTDKLSPRTKFPSPKSQLRVFQNMQ